MWQQQLVYRQPSKSTLLHDWIVDFASADQQVGTRKSIHSPLALSSAVTRSSSKAMLMRSSTKLLKVSFMVLVLRKREANGPAGFKSKYQHRREAADH